MDQIEDDPLESARLNLSIQAVSMRRQAAATYTERSWRASRYESGAMEIVGGLDWEMRVLVSEG